MMSNISILANRTQPAMAIKPSRCRRQKAVACPNLPILEGGSWPTSFTSVLDPHRFSAAPSAENRTYFSDQDPSLHALVAG